MGFTKLDEKILQSSIMAEDSDTFKVWIILLAACKEDGIAEVSAVYISAISHLSIECVLKSLEKLMSPDLQSRSLNDEGKRINRVDGGFKIINYEKYRNFSLKSAEAERKRLYRNRLKECPDTLGHCPDSSASASASESASKELYFKTEQATYIELSKNLTWLQEQEKYHPNLNILLSLEKAHTQFWGTEAGWEHTKKKKSKKKNWKRTYENALSQRVNQVWKSKEEIKNMPFEERASL